MTDIPTLHSFDRAVVQRIAEFGGLPILLTPIVTAIDDRRDPDSGAAESLWTVEASVEGGPRLQCQIAIAKSAAESSDWLASYEPVLVATSNDTRRGALSAVSYDLVPLRKGAEFAAGLRALRGEISRLYALKCIRPPKYIFICA
ncbi:hypothetical protein [Methylopila sp. M107]|uniref:hypothetical protein n=1 Tax=Methylopila sp. M107 TaxID=1101190 RepID=UPI0012DE0424|nr:hypothetical protein [Methylopila sp. M107]